MNRRLFLKRAAATVGGLVVATTAPPAFAAPAFIRRLEMPVSAGLAAPAVPTLQMIQHPSGMLQMWFGEAGDLPAGWRPCDGTNGTPDLRTRFARDQLLYLPRGLYSAAERAMVGNVSIYGDGPGETIITRRSP